MAPRRTYRVKDPLTTETQEALREYDPLMQRLLFHRGIAEGDAAKLFLNPSYDEHLHDPFLLTDMEKAVERVLSAIKKNEYIVIYTDYDCDGIPGGVILHDFLKAIGYEHFKNYIPHRHDEGYGFNIDSIAKFVEQNAKLIITVDCGIVDHAATSEAQKQGIDVIITDHHEPGETLPDAFAVINPKRSDDTYPFKGLCGSGVAYKLVQALIQKGTEQEVFSFKGGQEKWLLDMVGLATIADMVPLTDENRVLAHYGLRVLRKSRRPGLQHLLRKAGGNQRFLTEDDIGFTIGPRINAASRMDDPEDAFFMLATTDEGEAGERVMRLEKLNNERKGVVASMTKESKKRMKKLETLPDVIVLGDPEWRPSLVGLVANSLAEEFKRPAFLWGRDGKGILKGSCRSDGKVSTLKIMDATPDTFIEFGGHHMSGGFSVTPEKIHTLFDDLNTAYEKMGNAAYEDFHNTEIDADLTLEEITDTLVRTLASLAPFGEANPKPVFRFSSVVPQRVETFGKAQNHTRLLFETDRGKREAIAFFKTPEEFDVIPQEGGELSLIAHVEESFFMGRKQVRLRIIDIV